MEELRENGEDEDQDYTCYNFGLRFIGERQMVNSWNIKDPIQYKLDIQKEFEPEYWQWIQRDQIIYSSCQNIQIFIDQEVVKTFT